MKSTKEDGRLAKLYGQAMQAWDQMKAEGMTFADRLEVLDGVIRRIWPFAREWHYVCDDCGDTGWQHGTCTTATPCGRPFTLPKQHASDYTGRGRCTPGHSYVRPCFCRKGRALHAAVFEAATASKDDFAAAGRTKPMTRLGR